MKKLLDKKSHVTCKECKKIGDAVIVMEQPPSFYLAASDKDFPTLCTALDKQLKPILSERGVEKLLSELSGSNSANDAR